MGYSCDDNSLSHDDVYIPDPVPQTDEDDGFSVEPTTTSVVKLKLGDEHTHQVIDGFGCAFAEWSHRIWNNIQREAVMEDLFGKDGLNLNIFRGEIFPHYQDDVTGEIEFRMDAEYNRSADDPVFMNNYWYKYHGNECAEQVQLGQMWLVDYLSRKHKDKDIKYIFSVWSPPAKWKTNNSMSRGKLKPENYDNYANYLVDFMDAYEQKFGIDIYAVSPSNEPDNTFSSWSGCGWTQKELADFCHNNFRPTLNGRGQEATKIIYGEWSWWKTAMTNVNSGLQYKPELANDDVIAAGHGYSTKDEVIAPFEEAVKKNMHVWQTEVSDDKGRKETWEDAMRWAKTFHTYLANGHVNGFVWWAGARPCSTTGENLIQLEEALPGTTYYRVPRYYTYGQFSKFIDAGSHRMDVETLPSEADPFPQELLVSAYVKDNRYTFVLVNPSEKESFTTLLEIEGKEFQNMIAYTSSESVKWQRKKINPSLNGLRAVTVPKYSVVTVTGLMKDVDAQ